MASIIKNGNNLDRYYKEVLLDYDGEQYLLPIEEYSVGSVAIYSDGENFKTYILDNAGDWVETDLKDWVLTEAGSLILKEGGTPAPEPQFCTLRFSYDPESDPIYNGIVRTVPENSAFTMPSPQDLGVMYDDLTFFNGWYNPESGTTFIVGETYTIDSDMNFSQSYAAVVRLEDAQGNLSEHLKTNAYTYWEAQDPNEIGITVKNNFENWFNESRNIAVLAGEGISLNIGYNDFIQSTTEDKEELIIVDADGESHVVDRWQRGYDHYHTFRDPVDYGFSKIDNFVCYKELDQDRYRKIGEVVSFSGFVNEFRQSDQPPKRVVMLWLPHGIFQVDMYTEGQDYQLKSLEEYGYGDVYDESYDGYIIESIYPGPFFTSGSVINIPQDASELVIRPARSIDNQIPITYHVNGREYSTNIVPKITSFDLPTPEAIGLDEPFFSGYWHVVSHGYPIGNYAAGETYYTDGDENRIDAYALYNSNEITAILWSELPAGGYAPRLYSTDTEVRIPSFDGAQAYDNDVSSRNILGKAFLVDDLVKLRPNSTGTAQFKLHSCQPGELLTIEYYDSNTDFSYNYRIYELGSAYVLSPGILGLSADNFKHWQVKREDGAAVAVFEPDESISYTDIQELGSNRTIKLEAVYEE